MKIECGDAQIENDAHQFHVNPLVCMLTSVAYITLSQWLIYWRFLLLINRIRWIYSQHTPYISFRSDFVSFSRAFGSRWRRNQKAIVLILTFVPINLWVNNKNVHGMREVTFQKGKNSTTGSLKKKISMHTFGRFQVYRWIGLYTFFIPCIN